MLLLLTAALANEGRQPTLTPVAPTESVTNSVSGAKQAVYLDLPEGKGPFPAVVLVPGGLLPADFFVSRGGINKLVREGIAVIRFDPEGRGKSIGTEDYNGPTQQAGLRSIIKWAEERSDIQDDGVGVISYSFGVALAAGALAGGETGARFLLDWEGPPSRSYMEACMADPHAINRNMGNHACDDDTFWSGREAVKSIAAINVPYWRIHAQVDHHGGTTYDKLYEMMDAAAGHLPWIRLNNLAKTTKGYTHAEMEAGLLPKFEGGARDDTIAKYAAAAFKEVGIKAKSASN